MPNLAEMAPIEIRPPIRTDAVALGSIHVRAWQVGYAGMMPAAFLDGLRVEDRERFWAHRLELATDPNETMVVADDGSGAVGFAVFGRWRDDGREDQVGELHALNVHPDSWGTGAGRALLGAATSGLATMGYGEAVLWVVTQNARARRFYEIGGWAPDGDARTDYEIQGAVVDEVRYRRALPGVGG